MKKLIALIGSDNTGKNVAVRFAFEKLKRGRPAIEEEFWIGSDITAIMNFDGVRVGIATNGEPNTGVEKEIRLRETLRLFRKAGCQLIICTTRTRGKTVERVEKFSNNNGYGVTWIEKSRFSGGDHQRSSTESKAEEVVSTVKAFVRTHRMAQT